MRKASTHTVIVIVVVASLISCCWGWIANKLCIAPLDRTRPLPSVGLPLLSVAMRFASFLILCALAASVATAEESPPRPHILFFLADDFGYYNVGFRNQLEKTPVIDAAAKDSANLARHYVSGTGSGRHSVEERPK